jgi:putative transposase
VSRQVHYYGENHLHYLTANIHRRARIFDSDRFKLKFTQALADLRAELGFRIIGYVLMPEHCHLLIWRGRSRQSFANLGANYAEVIGADRQLHTTHPAAQRCSAVVPKNADPVRAAPTVHHHAHRRVWQRGGYDMNIWSEKKRLEKLNYMHANPVKRGLVSQPGDWPWSSWRFYHLEDASILAMDRMP